MVLGMMKKSNVCTESLKPEVGHPCHPTWVAPLSMVALRSLRLRRLVMVLGTSLAVLCPTHRDKVALA